MESYKDQGNEESDSDDDRREGESQREAKDGNKAADEEVLRRFEVDGSERSGDEK